MGEIFLGVVADDFTGASDVASFLTEAGVLTVLFNGVPEHITEIAPKTAAIVVALKTRTEPMGQAVRESLQAFDWLRDMGAKQLYLKYCSTFDSTAEGNIGPVTDAVMERYGFSFTVLCPSLPVNGRTVREGILYVNGVPLAESHMKDHPLTPMRESRIRNLMSAQGKYESVEIRIEDLDKNLPETAAHSGMDHYYLIPDYYEDVHGDQIAERYGDIGFLTGGSGLAGALGRRYVKRSVETADSRGENVADIKKHHREYFGSPRKTVLLAGSCSAITLRQIAEYQKQGYPSYRIHPAQLADGTQTVDMIWQWMRTEGENGLVYSSAEPEELQESQGRAREETAGLIEKTFSKLAVRAEKEGYTRFIIAGGETSGAVTKALGFGAFYIGSDVAPGVPVMTPLEQPGLRLVLKSGNFGQPDFFARALEMTGIVKVR